MDGQKMTVDASPVVKQSSKKTKIVYLELLRVIASFFVIVNHTVTGVYVSLTPQSKTWWAAILYFFASKTAVPIFVMISGVLMLGKVEDNKKHIKRFVRIFLDLLIFSVLYTVFYSYDAGKPIDILAILHRIYQVNSTNAFWYLYLYLGLMIMLPLLQRMSVNMSKHAYRYLIAISVVFMGFMPVLIHYVDAAKYNFMFQEPFFSVYIGLMFLGYYLAYEVEIKPLYVKLSFVFFIGGIVGQAILTYHEYCKNPADYMFLDDRTFLPITMTAAALFYLARWVATVVRFEWFWKFVTFLGGCSFGVYLLSDFLIYVLPVWQLEFMMYMHPLKSLVVQELIVFIVGVLVTMELKRIPVIKKLL